MTDKEKYEMALEGIQEILSSGEDFIKMSRLQLRLQGIFPELKESEDERIRRHLIDFIKESGLLIIAGYKKSTVLAWLEKQGEPTEINPSEFDSQLNRLLKQFESLPKEELASSLSFYLNVVQNDGTYKEEKQGEQKPNPCENCSIATNNCQKFPCTIRDGEQKPANWFQELEDKLANATPQQLAEWKEKYFKEEPAEWSEEDEENSKTILYILNQLKGNAIYSEDKIAEKCIDWLKSLKERYTWKPSDEQMESLEGTFVALGGYDNNLRRLINDLKKLREE